MKILLLLILFFTFSAGGQEMYLRNKNEDLESFINRIFPETKNNIVHKIIEGKWGDTLSAKKVVIFYNTYEEHETKAIILELISNNRYKRLAFDYSFGIGYTSFPANIESVFFYDTDDDGLKELVVVEGGITRGYAELIEYNEATKQNDTIPLNPSFDYCGYSVFGQNGVTKNIEKLGQEENYEWRQCDAASIKSILEAKKKNQ